MPVSAVCLLVLEFLFDGWHLLGPVEIWFLIGLAVGFYVLLLLVWSKVYL